MEEFHQALTSNGYPPQNRKYNDFINSLRIAQITTRDETAMYLATLLHESDGLRATGEYYNPASVNAYGNYTGRGYIQLSGIENYRAASNALGYDYVNDPGSVAKDPHAWNVSAWYWATEAHGFVPQGFQTVVIKGIRPLQPHMENRIKIYENVCNAFGVQPRL